MTWNVRKLISLRSQCTSITNRFLSLFDRFTAYYSCMSRNLRKLVSPDDFSAQCITESYFRVFYHKSYLTVLRLQLRLITTVMTVLLKCQKTHIFHKSRLFDRFSAQVSQIVFLAYLTVLRLITTGYDVKTCQKTGNSATSVHKYHKSCS